MSTVNIYRCRREDIKSADMSCCSFYPVYTMSFNDEPEEVRAEALKTTRNLILLFTDLTMVWYNILTRWRGKLHMTEFYIFVHKYSVVCISSWLSCSLRSRLRNQVNAIVRDASIIDESTLNGNATLYLPYLSRDVRTNRSSHFSSSVNGVGWITGSSIVQKEVNQVMVECIRSKMTWVVVCNHVR